MAYRGGHPDTRTSGLIAVVATHPQLVSDHQRARREHDAAQDAIDAFERRLATIERERDGTGVVDRVRRWIGRAHPEALRREAEEVRRALTEQRQQLAQLAVREQKLAARLAEIEAARVELSELEEARAAELRGSEGPAGDELRRLGEELARVDDRIASLGLAGHAADHGEVAIAEVREIVAAHARAGSLAEVVTRVHRALAFEQLGPSDRELVRARLREHLGFVRHELRAFGDALVACQLDLDAAARLALTQLVALISAPELEPPERNELVAEIESAAACVTRLSRVVNDELAALRRRRDAVMAQQRTLEGRTR